MRSHLLLTCIVLDTHSQLCKRGGRGGGGGGRGANTVESCVLNQKLKTVQLQGSLAPDVAGIRQVLHRALTECVSLFSKISLPSLNP